MNNIFTTHSLISVTDRQASYGHKGFVIWLTGLSAAGKSTIAKNLEKILFENGYKVAILDGDNIRTGLNKNLGFSEEDRQENIRRVAEAAKLFVEAGLITIVALISPFKEARNKAREIFTENKFIEVFVKANLQTCIERDPKGLYKKALTGEIHDFTGISSPYEEPDRPELVVDSSCFSVEESCQAILEYLQQGGRIK